MFWAESERIAERHPEWRELVQRVDAFWHSAANGTLYAIDDVAGFAGVDEDQLRDLLAEYVKVGVIERTRLRRCPRCFAPCPYREITLFPLCDTCDIEVDSPPSDFFSTKLHDDRRSVPMVKESAMPTATGKIQPWAGDIDPDEFLIETPSIGAHEFDGILAKVERYGICTLRVTAQSADIAAIQSVCKAIGKLSERQNEYVGSIKEINPDSKGRLNSGDTAKAIGLHVDGTQHEHQPAMLVFQYVADAKLGAESVFVDLARVFGDIPQARLLAIMRVLADQQAATYAKGDLRFTGPVFSLTPDHTLRCRVRFDEVIAPHPHAAAAYAELDSWCNKPEYRLTFKPFEGDIIVFDNWRLLHARDEVFGERPRRHRRAWIEQLLPKHQGKYLLGVRPLSAKAIASVAEVTGAM